MTDDTKQPPKPPPARDPNADSELPPDADLEERFNDFWKRNGAGIFGGIALGAVIVIGLQLYRHFEQKREDGIRAAYAEAQTPEELLAFAGSHAGHQLAALASLQVADARYAEGQYAAAAELYAQAARGFSDPVLVSRALLGQGMSLLQSGAVESGHALLEAVALDGAGLAQIRGEAAYHLAVSRWERGDLQGARAALDIILQLPDAPLWTFRANQLSGRLSAQLAGN